MLSMTKVTQSLFNTSSPCGQSQRTCVVWTTQAEGLSVQTGGIGSNSGLTEFPPPLECGTLHKGVTFLGRWLCALHTFYVAGSSPLPR